MAFGALCGTFPDIDVIFGKTPEAVMTLHRGFTHSIFFAPLFALALSFLALKLTRGRIGSKSWGLGKLTLLATLCLWLHTLLDCFTSFGTMALLPFSDQRVFIPSLYIVDPIYTLALAGLLLASLLATRKTRKLERAAAPFPELRPAPSRARTFAVLAVCWIFAWPVLSLALQQAAVNRIERFAALPGEPVYHILPEAFSPLYWKVVAQTDEAYYQGLYRLGSGGDVAWNTAEMEGMDDVLDIAPDAPLPYPRPTGERLAQLARESELFQTYNDFAMFIVEETMPWPSALAAREDCYVAADLGLWPDGTPLPEKDDTLLVLRDLRLDSVQPLAAELRNSVRVFQAIALLTPQGELKLESFIGQAGSTTLWRGHNIQ